LTITATPARHGPAGIEPLSGDVIGFVVQSSKAGSRPIYISGDTTWFDGVAEVARRFNAAWCCRSPAQPRPAVRSTSPWTPRHHRDRAGFADSVIVPVHTDGWAQFPSERAGSARPPSIRWVLDRACRILEPGVATVIEPRRGALLVARQSSGRFVAGNLLLSGSLSLRLDPVWQIAPNQIRNIRASGLPHTAGPEGQPPRPFRFRDALKR
jgi:hypothetical protein